MSKQPPLTIDLDETTPAAARPATPDLVEEDGTPAVVDEDADLAGGLPARAVTNADGSITLPLRHPVTLQIKSSTSGVRSDTFAKLTFGRLTGGDIRAIQSASKESQPVVMFARSTRTRDAVMAVLFDKLDAADIVDGSKIIDVFLGGGRKTQD